jgi:flagellar hook-associated protein 3 FlgL
MVMRVTESMKFNTSIASMFNVQSQYNDILEKMASQKKINKPSDDPLGMATLLGLRQATASINQYQKNIDSSNGWLTMTESKLSSVNDILTNVTELAIGQGTATSSAETRHIAGENVQQLIDEMLSLANSKYGDRYLFSGSRMDAAPFSATFQPARIAAPIPASANTFDGTVAASGVYTAGTNKTYAVKIIKGGFLADATYQVSSDGGKTWGAELDDLDTGAISLPDGISLTLTDNGSDHLTAGDMFYVNAYGDGYYIGNGDNLTIDVGRDASINYSITGERVFAGQGGGENIFKVMNDLKSALLNNNQQGITAQLDKLKNASEQVNLSISHVGTIMNRLELAKNNLSDMDLKVAEMTSTTEDADVAELATSLAMKQVALQASYATASKIGSSTILDFLK